MLNEQKIEKKANSSILRFNELFQMIQVSYSSLARSGEIGSRSFNPCSLYKVLYWSQSYWSMLVMSTQPIDTLNMK